MKKGKIKRFGKRLLSASLVATLVLGLVTAVDIFYEYNPVTAYAAGINLDGSEAAVDAPAWNIANIPTKDYTGNVKYWYAGNAFYALNQLSDANEALANGNLPWATGTRSDSDTNWNGWNYADWQGSLAGSYDPAKKYVKKPDTTISIGKSDYSQNYITSSDYETGYYSWYQNPALNAHTWELMDTDAIWDDEYLYDQYQDMTGTYYTTSNYSAEILTDVNGWYTSKSWFSDAEKNAVKAANITSNASGSTYDNKSGGTYSVSNAHLFAPSIDEIFYNSTARTNIINNIHSDYSDNKGNNTGSADVWNGKYARCFLWLRSFWGVGSGSYRCGFCVYADGRLCDSRTGFEFAVAPAFYLNLEKIEMVRSAIAGTNVTANSGVAAYNPDEVGNNVKFLIVDDNFATEFTSSINGKSTGNIVPGNTYKVDYSGASTGYVNSQGSDNNAKLVVSAAIYDKDGKILYYSPISDVDSASGSASITMPSDIGAGEYTLAIFEEQLGGTSTYKTEDNTSNGTSFTQADGFGTYTNFESDYRSAGIAYMNMTVSDEDSLFDVVVNDGAYLYGNRTYTASDINQVVTATVGSDTLGAGEYFVMTREAYNALGSSDYATISASATVNKVTTAENNGETNVELPLVFVYFKDTSETAQVKELSIEVSPDQIENSVEFDTKTWYQSTENGITWNYKLNGNGDIIGLYTDDSIVPIVDGGQTLNIPAKVAGRTVIGIGSGSEEHPFVSADETSYTSLSFPSSVAIINDYAFYKTKAMANIVIPSTVTNIGVRAFADSSIYSLKINEMNGTIGSLAFGNTHALTNVTIKGGSSGLTVSTIAFRESNATSVSIKGNVTVNKNAFKNATRIAKIYLSGNISLGEYAFSGCTAVDTLSLDGTIDIGSYAFNNLTSLEHLYIPTGVTVAEYAFNGNSNLTKLEADVDLVNHAFEGCDKIQTLILDANVKNVEYDWEGHSGTYNTRNVYVKNKTTNLGFYGDGGTYYSSFGSSGDITVYVILDSSVDQGKDVEANSDGILTLYGYTCRAHSGDYRSYITGMADSVTFFAVNNIDTQLSANGVITEDNLTAVQTSIDAYYDGTILTTRDIDKDSMTVIPIYGSNEGDTNYSSNEFYIIRTTEFNELEASADGVTEAAVASYEPVNAKDSDLDNGQSTGTISVTVIVFYEDEKGLAKYYSTPVSVRVEEYSAKSYVEQVYGSYDNIAKELATLSLKVEELEAKVKTLKASNDADEAEILALTNELQVYKDAYDELLDNFAKYVDSLDIDETGYIGTATDPVTGEETDVAYIEGNAVPYTGTGDITADDKPIYKGSYDIDNDGTDDTIYFYVDSDGIHIVDEDGNDTGDVYTDTLGAIERKTAAKLKAIEDTLDTCENGLSSVVKALKDAGYEIDTNLDLDSQYKEVIKDIDDLTKQVADLQNDVDSANDSIESYEKALASIYALLTNSTLDKDNIEGINNTLTAISTRIQGLQNSLSVSQATVKDLQDKLNDAETEYSQLEKELDDTKSALEKAQADLTSAQNEKDALVAQYEKALADGDTEAAEALAEQIAEKQQAIDELTALQGTLSQKEQEIKDAQDAIEQLRKQLEEKNAEIEKLQSQLDALSDSTEGFKMTVDTANKLFDLNLAEGTSDQAVYDAIVSYVNDKTSAEDTIAQIKALIGSSNNGVALVNDVKDAISSGSSTSGTDDTVINENSASYRSGYTTGYTDGYKKAASDLSDSSSSNSGSNGSGSTSTDTATVATLNSQIASLTGQVTSLTNQNTTLQNKVKKLEDEIDDLEDDNDDLKDSNSSLKKSNSSLTSDVNSLKSENTKLSSQVTSLEGQVSTLKNTASTISTKSTVASVATATPAPTPTATATKAPDDDEIQGSTVNPTPTPTVTPVQVNSVVTFTDDSGTPLGTVYRLSTMPVDLITKSPAQKAEGTVIYPESGQAVALLSSNGKNTKDINGTASLDNLYKIMTYYSNNLDKLSELGSDELADASANENKAVSLNVVAAGDIIPSQIQESQINNGKKAQVEVEFDGIDNGGLYLVVHESTKRTGAYDVLLQSAKDGKLDFELIDLSPVAVAKVEIVEAGTLVSDLNGTGALTRTNTVTHKNNTLRNVVLVLLFIAMFLGASFLILLKLDKEGKIHLPKLAS